MHVGELQIDGGGTEAAFASDIENPGNRLIVIRPGAEFSIFCERMDSQSALETRNETVIQVWRKGLEPRPSDHARLDKPVGEVIVDSRKL
jgi:hypothetical protein